MRLLQRHRLPMAVRHVIGSIEMAMSMTIWSQCLIAVDTGILFDGALVIVHLLHVIVGQVSFGIVRLRMGFQARPLRVRFAANVAGEWFVTGMRSYVLVQVVTDRKLFATHWTLVWFFTCEKKITVS